MTRLDDVRARHAARLKGDGGTVWATKVDDDVAWLLGEVERLKGRLETMQTLSDQAFMQGMRTRQILETVAAGEAAAPVAPDAEPGGLTSACKCGDCYHPVIGPNTDGASCDWCRDCACPIADHTRMTYAKESP